MGRSVLGAPTRGAVHGVHRSALYCAPILSDVCVSPVSTGSDSAPKVLGGVVTVLFLVEPVNVRSLSSTLPLARGESGIASSWHGPKDGSTVGKGR